MTALEQALMQELEQEKALNYEIITRLETQETEFLNALNRVVNEFETLLEQNKSQLESLRLEQVKLYNEQKQMNEILTNLPSYESLQEDLQKLLQLQKN